MKRSWPNLKYVQAVLKNKMEDQRLPQYVRDWYEKLYKRLLWHESDVEDMVSEIVDQSIRNPAFPGDMVGWLDDDFDERIENILNESKSIDDIRAEKEDKEDEEEDKDQ